MISTTAQHTTRKALHINPIVSAHVAKRYEDKPSSYRRGQDRFLHDGFNRLPDSLRRTAESRWLKDEEKSGYKVANLNLLKITKKISPAGLAMASDDDAICSKAKEYEKNIEHLRQLLIHETFEYQYDKICEIVRRAGIEPPAIKAGVTLRGAINRMCAAKWWRSQLRATHKRWVEAACIEFGSVRRSRSLYVSPDCLAARKQQRGRNASALASMIVECEATGEQLKLDDVVESSLANPVNRRHEMMTRNIGIMRWAEDQGHACSFLTVTAPSRMHACSTKGKDVFDNWRYNGTTPREAQAYMTGVWARSRSEFERQGLTIYGLRVAEPHHDGTPHWHLLIYGTPEDLQKAEEIYEEYACADHWGEWVGGNMCLKSTLEAVDDRKSVRFKVKRLKWVYDEDGELIKSPVAYVAKYISKNLETSGIENRTGDKLSDIASDECKATSLGEAIARVDAWRSCWGIRQFQFFGTHAVTIWRELRKIRREFKQDAKGNHINDSGKIVKGYKYDKKQCKFVSVYEPEWAFRDWPENVELWKAYYAANKHEYKEIEGGDNSSLECKADWRLFTEALNAIEHIRVISEPCEHLNGYGEESERVIGIYGVGAFDDYLEVTRSKRWEIKQGGNGGGLTLTYPWSPSNNCTVGVEKKSGGHAPPDK